MNRKKHTHLLKTLAGPLGILLALLAYACASPGTPDGGPYDEDPPVLLKCSPELMATNNKQKKITLTFGLDLYAPQGCGAAGIQEAFDRMAEALRREGPPGLSLQELSCGETEFDREAGLYHRKVEAVCQGYLYAVADEGGTFLDFIVRGEVEV